MDLKSRQSARGLNTKPLNVVTTRSRSCFRRLVAATPKPHQFEGPNAIFEDFNYQILRRD